MNAASYSRPILAAILAVAGFHAQAVEVRFQPVAPGVFAFIGDTGPRTPENEGLNANIGLVVTDAGALLIDSGASFQGARQIHEAVRQVTSQPVKWVFNTGGQDHRWLGNGYFVGQGAEIIAHAGARADMQDRGNDHLAALRGALADRTAGTVPALPTRWLASPDERLELGGVVIEFRHRGGAHTPGDTMVWLPRQNVLFTGDVVYVDRMLGVLPVSRTARWLDTFAVIEQIAPAIIVPGHGSITTVATAKADTQALLLALRAHMRKAVDDGVDMSAAVRSFDAQPFMRLRNAPELMPGNASRTYLELERE